jgi:GNAT superfamily N-acetyltransferase
MERADVSWLGPRLVFPLYERLGVRARFCEMSDTVPRTLLFRLREARRALPARDLATALAAWLVRRVYLVTSRNLRDPLPSPPSVPGVTWTTLREADIVLLVASKPTLTDAEVRGRLAEGQRCAVGWLDGRPAHWRWEADGEVYLPYLGRRLRPGVGDRWVTDVYTHPAYRGRGLYTASTMLALRQARDQGLTRMLGMVSAWNRPAIHVMTAKAGRAVIGTVGYWQLGPWRRYFARGEVGIDAMGAVTVRPR